MSLVMKKSLVDACIDTYAGCEKNKQGQGYLLTYRKSFQS